MALLIRRRAAAKLLLTACAGLARSTARAADPPPPLPVAAFFHPPSLSGAALSPSGMRVAMRVGAKDSRDRLAVLDLVTMKVLPVAAFADADVDAFRWVNDTRLVFNLGDRRSTPEERVLGPGLYAVNADGSGFRQLVQAERPLERDTTGTRQIVERERIYAPDSTGTNQMVERERTSGRDSIANNQLPAGTVLLDQPGGADGTTVFVLQPEAIGSRRRKLVRLNTVNGRAEDVDAPAAATRWLIDLQGELRAVLVMQGGRAALHYRERSGGNTAVTPWRVLRDTDPRGEDHLAPWLVLPDGQILVGSHTGRDTDAALLLDATSGRLAGAPLLANPQYDIDLLPIVNDTRLLGLRWTADAEVTQWFDESLKSHQAQVDKLLPATANALTPPRRGDSPWLLVRAFADVQPALHFVYHTATGKLTRLGSEQPEVQPARMAATDLVRYKARDGLEIPAYLTLPPGKGESRNLPLVVLVHAGPWQRGAPWQWLPEVQFLASRGYAVLQPDFRGSTGFGQKHFRAGWLQWSAGMLDDLVDGARWAVAQGMANADRICLMGSGYGGLATMLGLARDGNLFRCGVQWAGLPDTTVLADPAWAEHSVALEVHGTARLVGALDSAATSALQQAERIRNPLLMGHGRQDRRVPVAMARRLRDAVQRHNPDVEWAEYDKEGHGWWLAETRADWWARVEKFLARHLAARPTRGNS